MHQVDIRVVTRRLAKPSWYSLASLWTNLTFVSCTTTLSYYSFFATTKEVNTIVALRFAIVDFVARDSIKYRGVLESYYIERDSICKGQSPNCNYTKNQLVYNFPDPTYCPRGASHLFPLTWHRHTW